MAAYDLVVIGTGAAASTVAYQCRRAGWSVAVADSRPFGGTCALRGCDPKKVLVAAAEAVEWPRRMDGRGVAAGGTRIDWEHLVAFKRTFTDPVPASREEGFRARGIATYHGRARFDAEARVAVGDDVLEAGHVVIATGSKPAALGVAGEEHLRTSEAFLDLDRLPARIVFVGGGYISCEFAHVARRADADVSIVHRGTRLLERFDPDLVVLLTEQTRRLGIDVRLGAEVRGIEKDGDEYVVRGIQDDEAVGIRADLVVHGAGRVAEIDDLDLERGGVARGRRGIEVNGRLQSVSNPRVYAAGDCAETPGPPLTPVAGLEGAAVAASLLGNGSPPPDYRAIPSVAFTVPPIAAVGLSEGEARSAGRRVRVTHDDTASWYSSRRRGEACAGFKVLIDDDADRILGAHLLGAHAEEVINLFALAIRHGVTATQLRDTVFAYPTHGYDVRYML